MDRATCAGIILLFLTGCNYDRLVKPPTSKDCYVADRTVNASPIMGASAVLQGNMVSAGCAEFIRAAAEAKKAGIDIDVERILLED